MPSSPCIFVVEDNADDILLIKMALEEHRVLHELIVAGNSDEVTSVLRGIGRELPVPDLILVDLNIPGADGPSVVQRIRDHSLCSQMPLIVVTSSDSPRDREWTAAFRPRYYFRKPSDYDQFMTLGKIVHKTLTDERG